MGRVITQTKVPYSFLTKIKLENWFFMIIIIMGLFSYHNIFNNPFIFDDENYLLRNNYITNIYEIHNIFTTPTGPDVGSSNNFYRPIQLLLYSIIYFIFGFNIFWYHLLNLILHLSNAILIYILISKIFNKNLGFLTSLIWVVHPIHTEAITYINGTADPLSLFFMLLSFMFYLKQKQNKKKQDLVFSILFFILALLSKETSIIFPLFLVIYEFVLRKENHKFIIYKKHIFYFFISLIYFLCKITVLNFSNSLNFYSQNNIYTNNLIVRILTFFATLPNYYSFFFWPTDLHMEREFPIYTTIFSWLVLLSILIIILLIYVLYKLLFKNKTESGKIISFGILWFFIALIPMSGIIPVNALLLEHWLYTPSIGFCLIISYFLIYLINKFNVRNNTKIFSNIIIFTTICIIFILSFLTINQNKVWGDTITFYSNILKFEPGTARVHNNLGMAYADSGNLFLAEKEYLTAINISDSYPQPHYNLATIYIKTNELQKAVWHLERSLEINPNFPFSYLTLIQIYNQTKNTQKLEYYSKMQQKYILVS